MMYNNFVLRILNDRELAILFIIFLLIRVGNFGQVYRGLYFKTDDECESVAIKTIQRSELI